ncbi:MAG: hypothetical protein IJK23_13630 [Clostridia bacterium]|nr:hypothetical protein [Clostridia bacterium]MBR0232253.1 hypothetical protein [Clostridia bacterium]
MSINAKGGKTRKKLSKTMLAYIIFTGVITLLCVVFLIYCAAVVREYDREQPERRVEEEIVKLQSCIENGRAEDYLNISSVYTPYYGKSEAEYVREFNALVASGEIGYKVDTGAAAGLERMYYLTVNGKPFARALVSGKNERTKLFFFSTADWEVVSVTPIPLGGGKELSVFIPNEVRCTVNGREVFEAPEKEVDGVPLYVLKNLPAEVRIEYSRADGTAVGYSTVEGVVVPDVYSYSITLPEDITVKVNGEPAEGEAAEKASRHYEVRSMTKPDVKLYDPFGAEFTFDGATVPVKSHTLELPDNFVLKAGEHVYSKDLYPHAEHPDNVELQLYDPGVKLRDIVTYNVSSFDENDKTVTLTNNLGTDEERTVKYGYRFKFTGQCGVPDIPAEISAEIDPLKFAVDWSLYMTNDQTFKAISQYYVKGSRYYNNAEAWLHSIDRTFTSDHNTPKIVEKRLSDFVRYSDTCFSVRAYVDKTMYLHRTGETIHDITDLFVYFIKYDPTPDNGTDDAKWIVAAQYDAKGVKNEE